MRKTLLALACLLTIPLAAQATPSLNDPAIKKMRAAVETLNDICRNGLADDKAQDAVCDARDQTYQALRQRQICYGRKDQITADWRWHICGKDSL